MNRTPLHAFHADHGASFVDFAGWEMPIRYGSIVEEHLQTRRSGGLFDVSHMGRLRLKGLHSKRLLERVCTRRINGMVPGQCRYTLICNEQGGVKDDVIVMKLDEDEFTVVCNASNREKIVAHLDGVIREREFKTKLEDQTEKTAMVALQGPGVMEKIGQVSKEVPTLKRYRFAVKNLVMFKIYVSRTGYTGEDGVEVILPANAVTMALKLLLKDIDMKADEALIKPVGLGARDTLRLEAGMPLYGHELSEETNALACGVDFAISLDKSAERDGETFIGQDALLQAQADGGPEHKLVGLKLSGKRTPRQGHQIFVNDAESGVVTSGCASPTLGHPIAMGFVKRQHSEPGQQVVVELGEGKARVEAEVAPLPFYKLSKA